MKNKDMAIVNIREKCITIARNEVRRNSSAICGGRSIFIKRCYGTYRLMAMDVTAKQRGCRTLFADAQRLAAEDMKLWNRRRYWKRLARAHKVKCGHRMAVSWYYRMLKERGLDVDKARVTTGEPGRGEGVWLYAATVRFGGQTEARRCLKRDSRRVWLERSVLKKCANSTMNTTLSGIFLGK